MNRADYGWDKHLNVSFVGEQGLDSGGPRRNLMELTVRGLINWGGLWCGKEGHLIPAPDFLTLQNRSHCMAGRIVGTVLVQSSLQLNIFAESLINTIAGINQWFVEDVADETVQSKLKGISRRHAIKQLSITYFCMLDNIIHIYRAMQNKGLLKQIYKYTSGGVLLNLSPP